MSVLSARLRRATVATASLALLATASPLSPAAAAPVDARRADQAADWLGGQLDKGRIVHTEFGPDWGLTIDTAFALTSADRRDPKVDRIGKALRKSYRKYVAYGDSEFAGSWGKLLLATRVLREKPRDYAGVDVRAQVLDMIAPGTEGFEAGRARDTGSFGDNSNTIGQSYVVLGLARTGGVPQAVVGYLRKQQCSDGFFRIQMVAGESCNTTGSDPDIDATAIAMQALAAAKKAGATVPARVTKRAGRWLVSVQGDNGAFGGRGVSEFGPNANSTGLAAAALAMVGGKRPEVEARNWLRDMQLTKARADVRRDTGAIAYNGAARKAASRDGITKGTRDEFRRATAQAIWGLQAVDLGTLRSR